MARFRKRRFAVVAGGLVMWALGVALPGHAAEPRFLEQNWTALQRQAFYTTTQGSQMVPYDWFRSLEQADSRRGFFSDGLARHGYLPNPPGPRNLDGLPVGFAVDIDRSGWWIGFTCAACHTNQIVYDGTVLQIDGAPTQADMYALLVDIRDTFRATIRDQTGPKFERFARRVLGTGYSPSSAAGLHRKVTLFTDDWAAFVDNSTPDQPWGRARLDAFGMIFNRVSAIDLGIPSNNAKPDAPTSYPFLWGTPFQDKVQWNGSAPNKSIQDRLGRNVGEVLGVFAKAKLKNPPRFPLFYKTSARRANLLALESLSGRLTSPVWPEDVLGEIDRAKANAGSALFQAHCVRCHRIVPHGQQNTRVEVTMTPISEVQTDARMARNACEKTVSAGPLAGKKMPPGIGPRLPERPRSLELVAHVVAGAIFAPPSRRGIRAFSRFVESETATGRPTDLIEFGRSLALDRGAMSEPETADVREQVEGYMARRASAPGCGPDSPLMAYKGRPLDGIWATAPYLHNGSVANLYEILLPADQRMTEFHVGSTQFDPKNVGFETQVAPGTSKFDTTLPGNSNSGHDTYGNDTFTAEQRQQLVEYMKTL